MNLFKFNDEIRDKVLDRRIQSRLKQITDTVIEETGIAIDEGMHDISAILLVAAAEIEVLKGEFTETLSPKINKLTQEFASSATEGLEQLTDTEVSKIEKKEKVLRIDIKRMKLGFSRARVRLISLIVAALVGLDSLTNFRSIQVLVDTLWLAALGSIFIAMCIGMAVKQTATRIQKAASRREKIVLFSISVAAGFLIFLILGYFRQRFYGADGTMFTSPFGWAIFNSFFYATGVAVCVAEFPTQEQRLHYDSWKAKRKELKQLHSYKSGLLSALQTAHRHHDRIQQRLRGAQVYRDEKLTGLYKQRNLIFAKGAKEYELKGGKRQSLQFLSSKPSKS